MGILIGLLLVLEGLCCLLLIVIILMQKSKGGGMGAAFGGEMGSALFGSRAGNVLTKATITLGIVFLANTLLLAILISGRQDRSLMEQYGDEPAGQTAPVAPTPDIPDPAQAPQTPEGGMAPQDGFPQPEESPAPVTTPPAGDQPDNP